MHIGHPVTRLVFALAGCLLLTPGVGGAQNQSVHINDANGPLERCDQLDISFDGRSALRDEETLQLPVGNEPLQISSDHGGVALRSGTANQHEITLCKAVPDGAGADLPAIRAHVNGARVEVTGPAGRGWVGYLLVRSPRGSGVGLSTTNGPVRAESFEGHLTVKSTNGPISLALVTGNVAARAENGPIKVDGGGGDVSVETQNGPIDVRLVGTEWEKGELVARAQNGPLSVQVPAQYHSGVDIESAGHSPWSCQQGCGASDDGSGVRRAHLGDGPTRVRLSTVNGPVKVR